MDLIPIGVVRSTIRERSQMPPLGAPAAVEVFEPFAAALHRLDKHTHLWVMAWLGEAGRDVLQVTPRGVADRSEAELHGVFAVRSPARPNPIGLTAARIESIDGRRITLDRVDFIDGTAVVDLKPYFVTRDAIFSSQSAQIGRPADREALAEALLMQAVNFHGEDCPEVAAAVGVVAQFRADALGFMDPEGWTVTVPAGRTHLIDAVIGMTRALPGRGTLRFHDHDSIVFERGDERFAYDVARLSAG